MEDWSVDFIAVNYDLLGFCELDQLSEEGSCQDRASGVVWVAVEYEIQGRFNRLIETHFIMIIFVFFLTSALSSSRSSFQSFFGSAFHKSTSAPNEAGIS